MIWWVRGEGGRVGAVQESINKLISGTETLTRTFNHRGSNKILSIGSKIFITGYYIIN